MRFSLTSLFATTSVVALTAAGAIGTAQPALAQDTMTGIYAGGSTLASQAFRQLFDCYVDSIVHGDGFTFSSGFATSPPTPTLLPTACSITTSGAVEGLYAGVGSGNGLRGYISNNTDQWYGGTISTTPTTITPPPFPSNPPPFVDNTSNFGTYPYPQLDIALSDAPLPITVSTGTLVTTSFSFSQTSNWMTTGGSLASVSVTGSQVVTYNTTNFGQPIQLPAFEANVAIAVNTNSTGTTTWSIHSTSGLSTLNNGAGKAIQLTGSQLCAIFSGLVTNWNSTATIAELTNGALGSVAFDYANTTNGSGGGTGATAYVTGSLPISVVYRLDGSGTSFIITNFLHSYCPLLDTGTGSTANGYSTIFGTGSGLPSTSFNTLITNIKNYTPPMNAPTHSTTNFVGATGSGGVAATIGNTSAGAGAIGYVSADFTFPYSPSSSAPLSASLQNENQRINGVNVPGNTVSGSGDSDLSSGNFIAPTPAGVGAAWADTNLVAPTGVGVTGTADLTQYNVYGQTYATGTTHGGVKVDGTSILAMTNNDHAYPLAGTTFLAVYSCYHQAARATQILTFLKWLYSTSNKDGARILQKSGFQPLVSTWASPLTTTYLTAGNANVISSAGAGGGCPMGASGAM